VLPVSDEVQNGTVTDETGRDEVVPGTDEVVPGGADGHPATAEGQIATATV
jgi:hypothetical protein